MRFLVTGSAGFIGAALCKRLLNEGHNVIGIDNLNDYYDLNLKKDRLLQFSNNSNFVNLELDLSDQEKILEVFEKNKFDAVINLAAQAGVRYSIKNPEAYVKSNLIGFSNILEASRKIKLKNLIFASSSSVYGGNLKLPFSTKDDVNKPLSFYAATKIANELMAHSYSHIHNLQCTGLRFFTVYGPWDRPDMALQSFSRALIKGEKIKLFNNGNHLRDFTYIDDIIEGIVRILNLGVPKTFNLYNIGSNNPINLMDFIEILENSFGLQAEKEFLPLQEGDMQDTYADISDLEKDFGYRPSTTIEDGIFNFVSWFKEYYDYK